MRKCSKNSAACGTGRLVVGKCAYSTVVLANCRELKENTVRLLTSYLKEGGKLAVEGAAPAFVGGVPADLSALKSNISLGALPKPSAVVACECEYTCRTLDSGARFVLCGQRFRRARETVACRAGSAS